MTHSTPEPDSSSATIIKVEDLTKVYHMGEVDVHALRGISLDVKQGQSLVLLGHSGSGKSTLLNIIGGLDKPSTGHFYYRGREMTQVNERELTQYRRHSVGFVFQFYNLIPSLTARENVELVTEISDDPLSPEEALSLVGMRERMDHFPAQLSGGEQQRVAIARAIAKRPDVLLCDEPTGALDITTGILVLEALDKVNKELGTTLLVITHNAAIGATADTVLTMADGRISERRQNSVRLRPKEISW